MSYNLKGKNLLSLLDFNKKEIDYLLTLARDFKRNKKMGITGNNLADKNIALIFEKPSTRTRCAFAVAAKDEKGSTEYLGKNDIQLGKKETVADTARVLGRMFDGIQYRGFAHKTVELLAEFAGVPVWNGLTDKHHPTQILADLMTVRENFGKVDDIKMVYVGDGRNNVANSLMIGAAQMGMDFKIVAPETLWPDQELIGECKKITKNTKGSIKLTPNPEQGVRGANVLYTDVWVSMGEESKFEERINLLKPYQINQNLVNQIGHNNFIFMHCLPAYHNKNTENAKKMYEKYGIEEMEVTDKIFESEFSRVFDQAENRMHTIKAVMVATLGN